MIDQCRYSLGNEEATISPTCKCSSQTKVPSRQKKHLGSWFQSDKCCALANPSPGHGGPFPTPCLRGHNGHQLSQSGEIHSEQPRLTQDPPRISRVRSQGTWFRLDADLKAFSSVREATWMTRAKWHVSRVLCTHSGDHSHQPLVLLWS